MTMFEDTKEKPNGREAANYTGALKEATAGVADAPPLVMPGVSIDQAPKPPKPAPPPHRQVKCERVFDKLDRPLGLDLTPLPGNAITRVELRSPSQDGKWKVAIFTEPRRGRGFGPQGKRKGS
jgi:hypothetical protein